MIAILATYVIKSRQNEIVTWTAAGQSAYRLLLPSFVLMAVLGFINWQIQEVVLPPANQTQERIRNQIRSLGVEKKVDGRTWYASGDRIYSFDSALDKSTNVDEMKRDRLSNASDNESTVFQVDVYEFSNKGQLQTVYRSASAYWLGEQVLLDSPVQKSLIGNGSLTSENVGQVRIDEQLNPFVETGLRPNQMDSHELKGKLDASTSESERRSFSVALQKKYSTLLVPLIISLFTAPFSLSLNRRSKVVTVGYAVAVWLVFTASVSFFEQLGLNGSIDPEVAIWGPLAMFSVLGMYFLTRVRT